jgi:hypothetical protein
MKKFLLAAGVASLVVFGSIGCSSTCCSKPTTANCATGQCATPTTGTPMAASSGMTGTSQPTTMMMGTNGRPPLVATPTNTGAPVGNPMLIPPQQ